MSAELSLSEWQCGMERIHEQADGVLTLLAFKPADIPDWIRRAQAGDADALRVLRPVGQALRNIRDAPRNRPMLCASCPGPLRDGNYPIVVATPKSSHDGQAMSLAVCLTCAQTHEQVLAKAVESLRQHIWPEARPVVIHSTAGHE